MADKPEQNKKSSKLPRRTVSRIAAIQALYQSDMTGDNLEKIFADFAENPRKKGSNRIRMVDADWTFFEKLTRLAVEGRENLEAMIAENLSSDWTMERLDKVLKNVLVAGACEVLSFVETPAAVLIAEYVEIARGFFSGSEPEFVHGVLDTLIKKIRT